jgi:uncharacterized membrane protein YcaP (DUF421 family)
MAVDWGELFRVTVSPFELLVRGTLTYWFIFVLFRVLLRRGAGAVGIADILLLVLIADAAQNAMSGDYKTLTEGAILVATIVGWSVVVDWAAYRFPRLGEVLESKPLTLIERGKLKRRNLREEFIGEDELLGKLREQGVERIEDVKRATMESDGTVSVIRYQAGDQPHAPAGGHKQPK